MEEFFPLYFTRTDREIKRGLSAMQSVGLHHPFEVLLNPRRVPDRDPKYDTTLVFDLDQTLISAEGINDEDGDDPNTELIIRPHASEVLTLLRRNIRTEFIVWTAGTLGHAERVVSSFPEMHFDYIIARDPSWFSNKNPVKDLRLLTREHRNLDSMILIDDRMDIGKHHPINLLIVPPFCPKIDHASDDATMLYLVNILQRALNKYQKSKGLPLYSYLFSPLVEKCTEDGEHYYGVKSFESKEEILQRIKDFKKIH